MLKIKRLEFEYVLPFGKKTVIDFPDRFNVSVIGQWFNQPKRSNYTGKSSFIELIRLLIYGKCRAKYQSEIPNDKYNKIGVVHGVIVNDDIEYALTRTFNGKSSTLEIQCDARQDLQDFQKTELQTELDNIFGLTEEEFVQTCFFKQGDVSQLMEAQPTAKLELLNKWLSIEDWDNEYEQAKNLSVDSDIIRLNDVIEKEDEVKEKSTEFKAEVDKLAEALEGKKKEVSKLIESQITVEKKKSSFEKSLEDMSDTTQIDFWNSELEKYKKDYSEMLTSNETIINELEQENIEEAEFIRTAKNGSIQIKEYEHLIKQLKVGKTKLENDKEELIESGLIGKSSSNICPILKEPCDRIASSKKEIDKAKKKYDKVRGSLADINNVIEEHNNSLAKVQSRMRAVEDAKKLVESNKSSIEVLKKEIRIVDKESREKQELEGKIKKFNDASNQEEQDKLHTEINVIKREIREVKNDIDNLNNEVSIINKHTGQFEKSVEDCDKKLEDIKKAKKNIKLLKKKQDALKFVKHMFSKRGIRASQLRSYMNALETEANNILEELDAQLQVTITTDRETTDWEVSCPDCGFEFPKGYKKRTCECGSKRTKRKTEELDIKIINRDSIRSFNQESGGAKILTSLAIRLAIISMRRKITGASSGILVLDEIVGMLDEQNRKNFYNFLINYAQKKLNFEQIFNISHMNESDITDGTILVTRKQNYSTVEWI